MEKRDELTIGPKAEEIRPSLLSKSSQKCQLCNEKPHKYKCGRCDVLYCSLSCFKSEKSHGECYESFCKDQVEANLKDLHVSKKV